MPKESAYATENVLESFWIDAWVAATSGAKQCRRNVEKTKIYVCCQQCIEAGQKRERKTVMMSELEQDPTAKISDDVNTIPWAYLQV